MPVVSPMFSGVLGVGRWTKVVVVSSPVKSVPIVSGFSLTDGSGVVMCVVSVFGCEFWSGCEGGNGANCGGVGSGGGGGTGRCANGGVVGKGGGVTGRSVDSIFSGEVGKSSVITVS